LYPKPNHSSAVRIELNYRVRFSLFTQSLLDEFSLSSILVKGSKSSSSQIVKDLFPTNTRSCEGEPEKTASKPFLVRSLFKQQQDRFQNLFKV